MRPGSNTAATDASPERRARPQHAPPLRSAAHRPHVLVNMAITADGKIATANRAIESFGSRRDQVHLLELRATCDAVLCGAATAGGEGTTLGPGPARFRRERKRRGLAEANLRIVASGSARLNPGSGVFAHTVSPVILLTTENAPPAKLKRLRALTPHVAAFGRHQLDLAAALEWLHREWKVRRLLCEGGGELNDAMFRAGLVDELHLTVCPKVFGGRTAPTVAEGSGFGQLEACARFRLKSRRVRGGELFLVYDVVRPASRVSAQRAISQSRSESRLK